jgi:metal-responsive CopG/Arc/MetJ family transcriptional regulator
MYNHPMIRTNIYLPEPVLKKLQSLSKKTGVSVAELVRRALDEYLKDRK